MGQRHAWVCGAVACLSLLSGAAHALGADGADIPSNVPPPPYQPPPLKAPQRPLKLDARTLLKLALEQNAELLFARLQSQVSEQGVEAERDLYKPLAYGNARREGRSRQRTVEERLTASLGGINRLEETVLAGEAGVRMRAPTGAEVALALRSTQRRNNVIASATFAPSDSESIGALVLTLRQPLLRGAGRGILETDLRVARAERDISAWQFRQQALRVGSDALSAYWQLWRARESQALRQAALENARNSAADVQARVDGGRLAVGAADEALAVLSARRAELARGQQALFDAEARVRQMLDLPPEDRNWPLMPPDETADAPALSLIELAARLPAAQADWPPLRVAQLKKEQAQLRLNLAKNRKLPALDVQASYSSNSLSYGPVDAAQQTFKGRNPDWTIGVALELPIGEDLRGNAEYRAQQLKVEQAELEIHSVGQALASDLYNRSAQLDELRREMAQLQQELQSRESLVEGVQQQYKAGVSAQGRLLRLQADLLESRLRLIDAVSRLALAKVALQLVDGSLLSSFDVRIEE
ncbi:TolC family protein [soil metagenome]